MFKIFESKPSTLEQKVQGVADAFKKYEDVVQRRITAADTVIAGKKQAHKHLLDILQKLGFESVRDAADAREFFNDPDNVAAFEHVIEPLLVKRNLKAHEAYKKAQELPDYINEGVYSV